MENMEEETLGQRVRRLRIEQRWSQEELCRRASISKSFLSEVENDNASPGGQTLIKLADALGASTDYLLTGKERAAAAVPLSIPPSLADFAERNGLPFKHVKMLAETFGRIEAKRRAGGPREMTDEDWKAAYEALRALGMD